MKEFRFYSASYVTEDGNMGSNSSILRFETLEEAVEWFNTHPVITQEDLRSAFIPIYFKEIGNLSVKDGEK